MQKKSTALIVLTALLAGCSKDIVSRNDLGEAIRVKESTIEKYIVDKDYAVNITEEWIEFWQKELQHCNGLGLASTFIAVKCWETFGPKIIKGNNDLKVIPEMPEITIVKYRAINTNSNGDKSASGSQYVACIPDGKADDKDRWFSIISNEYIGNKSEKKIATSLSSENTIENSIRTKVCERHGNI